MSLHSCLYEGWVRHRRFVPVQHDFTYRLFLMYVDLDELPTLFADRWLWSASRPSLAWFRRADYLGAPQVPLAVAIRDLVAARCGVRPSGPIRLLTHFRYFGVAMNPISLYYCFDTNEQPEFVVAEVTNTPWGEQHSYVLDVRGTRGRILRARAPKELHVSPYLRMEFDYAFRLNRPGSRLVVQIENVPRVAGSPRTFQATLALKNSTLSGWRLARVLCRYPLMTVQALAGIYWQAFRLWCRGVPFVPHPARGDSHGERSEYIAESRTAHATEAPKVLESEDVSA